MSLGPAQPSVSMTATAHARFQTVWRARADTIAGTGLLLFALKLAGCGAGLAMHLVLARLLGAAEYGSFATAFNAAGLIALIATAGLPMTASRFLPAYLDRGERAEARGYLELVGAASVCGGVVGGLALVGASLTLGGNDRILAHALAAACPLVMLLTLAQSAAAVLQALHRPLAAECPVAVLRPLLVIAGCGMLAAWPGFRLDAAAALVLMVPASAAALVPVGVVLWRTMRARAFGRHRRMLPTVWAPPGFLLLLLVGGAALNERLDVMMIAAFAEPEAVGIYSAAARFASLISLGATAATVRALPLLAEQLARGARGAAAAILAQSSRMALALALLAGLPLAIGSGPLLGLFGQNFRAGAPALCLLVLANVCLAMGSAAASALIASGNERRIARITVLGLLLNVAASLVLIPRFGMNGAAAATCSAMAVTGVGLLITARRTLGFAVFSARDLRA